MEMEMEMEETGVPISGGVKKDEGEERKRRPIERFYRATKRREKKVQGDGCFVERNGRQQMDEYLLWTHLAYIHIYYTYILYIQIYYTYISWPRLVAMQDHVTRDLC